jgi:hypothetical protein
MTQKEIKELKEFWSSKTLGEVKGLYSEKMRIYNLHQESIREKAQELVNLDFNNKYYVDKAKNLMNDISFYKSYIVDEEKELNLLKPILDKKEIEGIDQAEYENYITGNINIQILIKEVNDLKQNFIDNGNQVIQYYKEKDELKSIVIILTEEETKEMYDMMLTETIMILKDRIGNIEKVDYLRTNNNKGLDGRYIGEKGTITINTILAGGYNIQKLHYRTLIYNN